MNIGEYLDEVRKTYASGQAGEHSYRPAIQKLFASVDADLAVINEPKKSDAGMPDFLFQRGVVPVGWAECKDIDKDIIRLRGYSVDQRKRYEKAYPNLIYSNGVDFEFIREGTSVHFVSIADFLGQLGGLQPLPDKFDELERQLRLFAEQKPISIRSAAKLAEIMAAKAAVIKDEIGIALADDRDFRTGLGGQYRSFKANLLPNLTTGEFADLYAETITYGLFAARFHDDDLSTFSRREALEKLPASNPFLKGLFDYIAGPALPRRLEYIVDDLVQVMRASDPHSLFRDFGKFTARNDPFVHFYEDFLAAYNPKKRKSRGVWYTPEPMVDFIVRAVDDVLKTEFGLADGLADTSKVTVDWDTGQNDKKGKPVTVRKEVHKVQILDPATGTGTFLAKAVQLISDRVKARAPGKWSRYVEEDLLPRLHGFELLMASYAMCHMKLDMMLTETGYKPSERPPEGWPGTGQWPPRLSVWLTNALEPAEREVRDLFFQPLAEEARGASEVKRQTPIMCVIGNPPYSVSSSNMNPEVQRTLAPYKTGLTENNIQPLSDDYVKFIRFAQLAIEKNGCGVLGFVTNHSYLTGIIHRLMRKDLMGTFDSIHVCDLHENSNKLEKTPEGEVDVNVFDIQQGVAIVIAVKKSSPSVVPATVRHTDVWGSRAGKNEWLHSTDIRSSELNAIEPIAPYFFFDQRCGDGLAEYERGFAVDDIFEIGSGAIQTKRDSLFVDFEKSELDARIQKLLSGQWDDRYQSEFNINDSSSYPLLRRIKGADYDPAHLQRVTYRPLDQRWLYYDDALIGRAFYNVMQHVSGKSNLLLQLPKQTLAFNGALAGSVLPNQKCFDAYDINYAFPLYTYSEMAHDQHEVFGSDRTLNLDPKLYAAICEAAGIDPADQAPPPSCGRSPSPAKAGEELADFRAATGDARPSEVKLFDYIYGVLHSPDYRERFAEFLKIDFPRIPYPPSPQVFAHVSEKGEQLRRLHLMEPDAIGETPYPYHGDGDDVVASGFPKFEKSSLARSDGEGDHAQHGGGSLRHPLARMPPPHPAPPDKEDQWAGSTSTRTSISIACRRRRGSFTSAATSPRGNG